MKAPSIIKNIKPFVNSLGPKVVSIAPEAMVIAGTLGLIFAGVWACKVTADKLPDILDEKEDKIDIINDTAESDKKAEKAIKKVNRQTKMAIVKSYALPVGLGVVSVASILGGNHIIKARYVAALAGMQGLQTAYDSYRARITDKYGEDADRYGAYGIERTEIDIEEIDENGKVKKTKKEIDLINDVTLGDTCSPYFRLIGPNSALYRECHGDPSYMRNQLEIYERVLNQMYDEGRPIYFNDAMRYIFGDDTSVLSDDGQIVGWYKYDKHNTELGDDRIDLRINTILNYDDDSCDGDELWFYIDPNVYGPVKLGH